MFQIKVQVQPEDIRKAAEIANIIPPEEPDKWVWLNEGAVEEIIEMNLPKLLALVFKRAPKGVYQVADEG
jgi:hypothetical protein